MNPRRLLKKLYTVVDGILVISLICRTEAFSSFSKASRTNSSNCLLRGLPGLAGELAIQLVLLSIFVIEEYPIALGPKISISLM
jgi:hypothetical protein